MKISFSKISLLDLTICLVFLTTPLESVSFPFLGMKLSLVKSSTLLLVLVWLLSKPHFELNKMIKLYLALAIYCFFTVFWAINPEKVLERVAFFLIPTTLICSIIYGRLKKEIDFRRIMISYLVGCIILAIYGYIDRDKIILEATYAEMERVYALGQDENEMSMLLNIGVGILLLLMRKYKKWYSQMIMWGLAFFIIFVMLTTGSRTGLVILFALLFVYFISNKRKSILLLPLLIIVGSFIVDHLTEGIIQRFLDTENTIREGDLSNRIEIWKRGIQAFQNENMAFGVGYMNFPDLMQKYYVHGGASHNTYLSAIICFGFLGSIFFYRIIYEILVTSFHICKIQHNLMILVVVLPVLLSMMTLETLYRRWIFLLGIVIFSYNRFLSKNFTYRGK